MLDMYLLTITKISRLLYYFAQIFVHVEFNPIGFILVHFLTLLVFDSITQTFNANNKTTFLHLSIYHHYFSPISFQ